MCWYRRPCFANVSDTDLSDPCERLLLLLFLILASLFISAWISLVLHEFSHAIAGHLAKLQIRELRIGLGPTAFRTRLLGMEIRVGTIPLSGWVRTFPQLSYSKSANLLFIAAGPVMDVVWLRILVGASAISDESAPASPILVSAIMVQIMVISGNLFPHYVKAYGQRLPNDMLALWKIIRRDQDPNAVLRQNYLNALQPYMSPDEQLWQPTGQSDRIIFYLSKPDLTDEDIAALEVEASTASRSEQLLIIERTAMKIFAQPIQSASRYNTYLDRQTERAVAMAPELHTLKGTRGAALARLGRHEEALNALAQADDTDDFNRCLNAAFRALAHFHAGRKELIAAELETAIAILRSHDWVGTIGWKIVNTVCVETGYPTPKECEPPKPTPENLAPPRWLARDEA